MLSFQNFATLQRLLIVIAVIASAAAARPANAETPISVLCVDAATGRVLYEENADIQRPPASMIKLMMMLVIDEGLNEGRWTLDMPITVSAKAEQMGGTQVYLKAGETWSLGKLMQAVAVASANDAAMAVAEGLWESETAYLAFINAYSRSIGMNSTTWHSVHGLPPDNKVDFDQTTARDMAVLARICVTKPRIMAWVNTRELTFREGMATKYNTNKMLWRMEGCDGMKTGFIRAAGFCVTATAERNGTRLIAIVMGSPSKYGRFDLAEAVMTRAFNDLQPRTVIHAGELLAESFPVAYCDTRSTALMALSTVNVVVRSADIDHIEYRYTVPEVLEPPLTARQVIGSVQLVLDNKVIGETSVAVPEDLNPNGWRLVVSRGIARWEGLDEGNAS